MHYFHDNRSGYTVDAEYPHCIIAVSGNQERLFQLKKAAVLTEEVSTWLDENIGVDNWRLVEFSGIITFKEKESAMAFLLRWS